VSTPAAGAGPASPYTVAEAVAWTGGRLLQGDPARAFAGTSIDTRSVGTGELFVAIRGPNHDAHAFLADALARGAAGVLVERVPDGLTLPAGVAAILVPDGKAGLVALARGHRARFHGPVIGLTGSNGKTTTKEMCAAILSVAGPCGKTLGNLNNDFGVPLTLLRRRDADRALVVEMGMNHRGEIAPLAALARPQVGIVTNVGTAHIEHLGSRENIALEKGDLVAALPDDGTAVLNADDPLCLAQGKRTRARVLGFGAKGEIRAEALRDLGGAGFAFALATPWGGAPIRIRALGATTIPNALAAAGGALAAGATLEHVAQGLGAFTGVHGRMERLDLAEGRVVIDDTYNANPQSMENALRSLAALHGAGRAIAVLGDMGELGDTTDAAHDAMGRLAGSLGLDLLVTLGEHAARIAAAARDAGLPAARAVHVADHAEAAACVRACAGPGDWILVKGSRSMRMERVVEALVSSYGGR